MREDKRGFYPTAYGPVIDILSGNLSLSEHAKTTAVKGGILAVGFLMNTGELRYLPVNTDLNGHNKIYPRYCSDFNGGFDIIQP
jgi:hypothetical protein